MKPSMRFRVFQRDNHTCQYCGRRAPDVALEVDHVHPRSKGGGDHPDNLVTACYECNRGKGAKVIAVPTPMRTAHGGALEGRTLACANEHTLLWVFAGDTGDLFTVRDEWVVDEGEGLVGEDDYGRPRFRWGHPGCGFGGADRIAEWMKHQDPKLRGFYVTSERAIGEIETPSFMWWDMERMIVELSA